MRPDAPVINDGCAVDDNGKFPGIEQNDLTSLLSSYLPGRGPTSIPREPQGEYRRDRKSHFQIHYSRTTGKTETDASSVD